MQKNDLEFLKKDPVDVSSHNACDNAATNINWLMELSGVGGVWREENCIIIYYTAKDSGSHLPKTVEGLPTRIVKGDSITAYGAA